MVAKSRKKSNLLPLLGLLRFIRLSPLYFHRRFGPGEFDDCGN
jgi:hypothetical protein